MNYLKFLGVLLKDLSVSNYVTVNFFRKNILSIWLWFTVLKFYYDKSTDTNIERIIKEIPMNYASRPTIFKLIDFAVDKNHLKKITNADDKRKINIVPTNITIKEFEEWSQMFRGF